MTRTERLQNLKGWPMCRSELPWQELQELLAQKQASGNLINHFLVLKASGRTRHYRLSLQCAQAWPLSNQRSPAASQDCGTGLQW